MFSPLHLGEHLALDVDFGGYSDNDLDARRDEVKRILRNIEIGRKASIALDLLKTRIATQKTPSLNQSPQQALHEMAFTSRYSTNPPIDLSQIPYPAFLGLIEFLSKQTLTDLAASKRALTVAICLLQ